MRLKLSLTTEVSTKHVGHVFLTTKHIIELPEMLAMNKSCASAMLVSLIPSFSCSADISIAPFAMYERAPENIIVDGVSTKYGLGVIGGQVTYTVPGTISISTRLGYGQNNDQEVSFSGATFNGQVTGTYLEAKAQKNILARGNTIVSLAGGYSERDLKADDLVGTRNGLALTGQSVSSISSFDLMLNLQQNVTDRLSATATIGQANWNLDADATAYFALGGIRANANKKIDTSGQDPIYKLGFDYAGDKRTIHASISQRSLRSKANTDIITGELVVTFDF